VSFHDDFLWTFDKKLLQRLATRQSVENSPVVAATMPIACSLGRGGIGGEAAMTRSADAMQEGAFTVAKLDGFVPAHHPLRAIRVPMSTPSMAMNRRSNVILAGNGRDAFAPEEPGRALSTAQRHSMCTANAVHTPDAITRYSKHQVIPHFIACIFGANSITSLMPS
jgi:hypothetical protein